MWWIRKNPRRSRDCSIDRKLFTNQLLYQLSYAGIVGRAIREAAELFSFRGGLTRVLSTLLRTGCSIPKQDAFLAVSLNDCTGALAGRQTDVDEKDSAGTRSRGYLGWQSQ